MPRNVIKKSTDFGSPSTSNGTLVPAGILIIDSAGEVWDHIKFLINPSSWEDSKTTKWQAHEIPGSSDPVYQWIGGGPRTVTFEALVTKDGFVNSSAASNPLADLVNAAINVVGSIASSFSKVNIPISSIADIFSKSKMGAGSELSIRSYLDNFRRLLYPTYTPEGLLQQSPPLVYLSVGSTLAIDNVSDSIYKFSTLWVVTELKISITKQLPNLEPMEATVHMTLQQYTITNKSFADFDTDDQAISSPIGL